MALSLEDKIAILTIHRNNIQNSKTFEEYRNAHVAYVSFLIEEMSGRKNIQDACIEFANYGVKSEKDKE